MKEKKKINSVLINISYVIMTMILLYLGSIIIAKGYTLIITKDIHIILGYVNIEEIETHVITCAIILRVLKYAYLITITCLIRKILKQIINETISFKKEITSVFKTLTIICIALYTINCIISLIVPSNTNNNNNLYIEKCNEKNYQNFFKNKTYSSETFDIEHNGENICIIAFEFNNDLSDFNISNYYINDLEINIILFFMMTIISKHGNTLQKEADETI